MSQQTWMIYAVMVFFMSATPGPNMLLALNHGIRHGFRATLATCVGLMAGLFLIMLGSVAGLGAILAASQVAFSIVKYAGALYLVYIGFRTWRAPPRVEKSAAVAPAGGNRWELFRTGVLVSLSNPKAFIFFMALFPQFMNKQAAQLPQLVILMVTFMVIETFWQFVYAGGGARLARWLTSERRMRLVNRLSGGFFMGAGVALGASRL